MTQATEKIMPCVSRINEPSSRHIGETRGDMLKTCVAQETVIRNTEFTEFSLSFLRQFLRASESGQASTHILGGASHRYFLTKQHHGPRIDQLPELRA